MMQKMITTNEDDVNDDNNNDNDAYDFNASDDEVGKQNLIYNFYRSLLKANFMLL